MENSKSFPAAYMYGGQQNFQVEITMEKAKLDVKKIGVLAAAGGRRKFWPRHTPPTDSRAGASHWGTNSHGP